MATQLNRSLLKALEILDLFSVEQRALTARDVVDRLDMTVQTAHRFLLTLEYAGVLVSPRRGQFTLGQKLEELGKLAFEVSPLPSLARPVVEALSRELTESVMACRLGRQGAVCIASTPSPRPIRVSVDVGTSLPFRTTAQGKLFLAQMAPAERQARLRQEAARRGADLSAEDAESAEREAQEVARKGFATNFGENESEIGAIAVPVAGPDGRMVLSLSVFGILSSFDQPLRDRAKAQLLAGKAALEATLCERGQNRLASAEASRRVAQARHAG
ncbi:hypothetical protein U879_19505 [Defluviimonas sp. 20V17]|uniref:IclR family transcriptional regulator n=1 Tax=Allgaiera indica TaxID=765699 RepID=A0AAN5A0X8_9RHOB|nr:IclR family transcriptional regulator [Allgaiera indica]KDB01997.1 hypothetical protein U879_19505 [Defluviimonas sp. 20V17]GHE03259.1 IclR family transcriptional regulator [Allgaiera indica]SDX22437.1 transcriptional regulator, IclR family [Allgaiera indica]